MTKISVVIPTYNRAATLLPAVKSVLRQTVADLEVLVCDDGSTDDSEKLILALNDSRVRWLACGRGGRPAIPRNHGLKAARGEWIALLDSDDEWLPEKLERQFAVMQSDNTLASSTNAVMVSPQGQEHGMMLKFAHSRITFSELLQVNYVICSSTLFHSSLLPKIGGFPEAKELTALEDYALWLRIASFTDFSYLADGLVRYTDAPQTSIRRDVVAPSPFKQQDLVLGDYSAWARSANQTQKLDSVRKRLLLNQARHFKWRIMRLINR